MVFSGCIEVELVTRSNNELKARNVTSMNQCKVGVEVHIKEEEGCRDDKKITRKRRSAGASCCKCCCKCCCRCDTK